MSLTRDRLVELLDYDADSGKFTWRESQGSNKVAGLLAGTKQTRGYWVIAINRKKFSAHRLAWLYQYGVFPTSRIDHINRDRCDNRISNLRLATRSQNAANSTRRCDNTSGYKGVYFHSRDKKWAAKIKYRNTENHLGYFDTAEAAHAAYCLKSVEWFGSFGSAG